jgi:hypothetical protein
MTIKLVTMTANGLQAWEVADASELCSFGKINFFVENKLPATENQDISYACC